MKIIYVVGNHIGHVSHILPLYTVLGGEIFCTATDENWHKIQKYVPTIKFRRNVEFFKEYEPDVIVYLDWGERQDLRFWTENLKAKHVWVPHGLSPKSFEGYKEKIDDFDVYFAASSYELIVLRDHGVNLDKVKFAGYPKFDTHLYQHIIAQPEVEDEGYTLYAPTWGGYSSIPKAYSRIKELTDRGEIVYVKAHPQVGLISWGDDNGPAYEKLCELPVKIIDKKAPNILEYIKKSSRVISDRGTVFFEAISMGKKVEVFYEVNTEFKKRIDLYNKPGMSAPYFEGSSFHTQLSVNMIQLVNLI